MMREVVAMVMSTVFAVEKSAMILMTRNALLPMSVAATVASGACDAASVCQGMVLMATNATVM